MKNIWTLLLGLIVLSPLAAAQVPAPTKRTRPGVATDNGGTSATEGSIAGKQSGKQETRVNTKDEASFERGGDKSELGGSASVDGQATGADAAGAPLGQPIEVAPEVVAPAYSGTPRQGLAEIERLTRDGHGEEAVALAEVLIERVALTTRDEQLQGELRYAAGVSEGMGGRLGHAALAFRSASALAGPGDLRLDSLYNTAAHLIEQGEELYSKIPEVEAKAAAQSGGQLSGLDAKGVDTLADTRRAFTAAKEMLISRLRIDWRDEDARANVEFVQRRLDELDRIEAKRADATSEKKSESGSESEKTEEGEGADKGDEENDEESDEAGDSGANPDQDNPEETESTEPEEGEGAKDGAEQPNPNADPDENGEFDQQEEQEDGED
ncbi:MAG: hypothetical protein ACI87A_003503, partial [Planctomycetota bacterium]